VATTVTTVKSHRGADTTADGMRLCGDSWWMPTCGRGFSESDVCVVVTELYMIASFLRAAVASRTDRDNTDSFHQDRSQPQFLRGQWNFGGQKNKFLEAAGY